jgi:nucleoside-diphosphate-sugar epimerase
MPTARPAKTGEEIIDIAAQKLNRKADYFVLKKWMFAVLSPFNPLLRELDEMMYQYQYDYIFDSSKFEEKFGFTPTSYEQGIEESVESIRAGREDT